MKKRTKTLLIGTVIAAAGYIVYSFSQNKNEKSKIEKTPNEAGSIDNHSTDAKVFVERRKQRVAEKRTAITEIEIVPDEQKETIIKEVVYGQEEPV